MALSGQRHRLFSYGTLKTGQPNHIHLNDYEHGRSQFIGSATTQLQYPLIIATRWNLPFLLPVPGIGHQIHGEVYEIDDDLLKWMDDFEDHPNVYERTKINVNLVQHSNNEASDASVKTTVVAGSKAASTTASSNNAVSSNATGSGQLFKEHNCDKIATEEKSSNCNNLAQVGLSYSQRIPISHDSSLSDNSLVQPEESQQQRNKVEKEIMDLRNENRDASSVINTSVQCWCYFLHKYPQSLLKREMYSCYDSEGMHARRYRAETDDSGPDNIADALEREVTQS